MKKVFLLVFVTMTLVFSAMLSISMAAANEYFPGNDPIDVVFIGGSITEGTSGSFGTEFPSGSGYATYVDSYLKEVYGENRVKYHNSGIGGTGSDFGFNRIYDECMKYDPELVFVEFAVNDYWAGESTKSNMESIVRSLQSMKKPPYIVFLYTAQYRNGDISSSSATAALQQQVADYYEIPSINLSENVYVPYVEKRVSDGADKETAIKEFLSTDFVHPTAMGHKKYGDYIVEQLKTGNFYKKATEKDIWLTNEGCEYIPHEIPVTDDMISGTFKFDSGIYTLDTGSSLTYKFTGPMISSYMLLNRAGGKINVFIDGKLQNTYNTYRNQNYDQRALGFWIDGLDDTDHTLRIDTLSDKLYIRNLYEASGKVDVLGNFFTNSLKITNKNGEVISSVVPGSLNIMNVSIQNAGLAKHFTLITAFYNDGRLHSIGTYNGEAKANEKLNFGIGFTAPESGTVTAKTMIWDGKDSIRPLTETLTIPVSK